MKRLFCRIFHADRMWPICGVSICRKCLTPWPVRWSDKVMGSSSCQGGSTLALKTSGRADTRSVQLVYVLDSGNIGIDPNQFFRVSQGPTVNSGEMAALRCVSEEG